jgi:hypothetical protein
MCVGHFLKNATKNLLRTRRRLGEAIPKDTDPLVIPTGSTPAEVVNLERTGLTTFTTIDRRVRKFQENKDDAEPPWQSPSLKGDPPQQRFALFSYLLKILASPRDFLTSISLITLLTVKTRRSRL